MTQVADTSRPHRAPDRRSVAEVAAERDAFFANSMDGMFVTSPDGQILDANPAACELLGRTVEQLRAVGRKGLADPTDSRWSPSVLQRRLDGRARAELRFLHADGTPIEAEVSSVMFEFEGGWRSATVVRDVRDRVLLESLLRATALENERLARLDDLTGLPNRRAFFSIAHHVMTRPGADERDVHLLVADVDRLKETNDGLGHAAGDQLLSDVATVLTGHFPEAAVVARLAGDEFAVLLEGCSRDEVSRLVRELAGALARHRSRHDRPYVLEVSVGVATRSGASGLTLDELLHQADLTMYRSKRHRSLGRASEGGTGVRSDG